LGYSGDGGPATSAELNEPVGVAVDSAGNLYIADFVNNRVRLLDFIFLHLLCRIHLAGGSRLGRLFQPSASKPALPVLGSLGFAGLDGGFRRILRLRFRPPLPSQPFPTTPARP
jgi:hypothetical protein